MPRVESTTGTLGKLSSDTFMGNIFDSLTATVRNVVLTASTDFLVIDSLEIGASFFLEIPATSTLSVEPYTDQAYLNTTTGTAPDANITFLSQSRMTELITIPSYNDFEVIESLDIGQQVFEIPATSSVEIRKYLDGASVLSSANLSDPIKFHVYRNAAQNSGNNAFAVLQCDAKVFDTGNNVDLITNQGRFKAPVAGFYWFYAVWQFVANGTAGAGISLFKNGTRTIDGTYLDTTAFTNAIGSAWNVSGIIQLVAGDYVEAQIFATTTVAVTVGFIYSSAFQGYLVSAT